MLGAGAGCWMLGAG